MSIERTMPTPGGTTWLTVVRPWGTFRTPGRVLCPDGRVRALARIAATPDTFFSIPAAVKVRGRTVSGYVTPGETGEYEFRPYLYGRNAGELVAGTEQEGTGS